MTNQGRLWVLISLLCRLHFSLCWLAPFTLRYGPSDCSLWSKTGPTQEMSYLSCCELCCKLSTAVWDLPDKKKQKTLNPCTKSSPQTPWNLVLICSHSLILPIKRFFWTPLATSTHWKLPSCSIVPGRLHIFPLQQLPLVFPAGYCVAFPNCTTQGSNTIKMMLCAVKCLASEKT